jgi:hypothetical protein
MRLENSGSTLVSVIENVSKKWKVAVAIDY